LGDHPAPNAIATVLGFFPATLNEEQNNTYKRRNIKSQTLGKIEATLENDIS
jgi:hypothetical protein